MALGRMVLSRLHHRQPMMPNRHKPPRGVYPPAELRTAVVALLGTLGPRAAAAKLRVRRDVLVNIAAGMPVLEGSVALVQQRLRETGAAA